MTQTIIYIKKWIYENKYEKSFFLNKEPWIDRVFDEVTLVKVIKVSEKPILLIYLTKKLRFHKLN